MAFFKKALQKADSTLSNAVSSTASVTVAAITTTATTVADTAASTGKIIKNNTIIPKASSAIHDPSRSQIGQNNHDRDNWVTAQQIRQYFRVSRGSLKFRFATDGGKVLIYHCWRPNQDALINLFEAVHGRYVKQVRNSRYKYVKYKEHSIKHHNYAEILGFVKGFISANYPRTLPLSKRRFAIRLAEFCAVSIDEIDGKYGLGMKAASQYYTVGDTLVDVHSGVGQIFGGKPVTGSINLVGSAAQNTAKFGVATAKSVVNTNAIKTVVSVPQHLGSVSAQNEDEKYILSDQSQRSDNLGINATKSDDGYAVKPGNIEGDSCPICYANGKSHALQCGHILCWDCVQKVDQCPFCKEKKTRVVKLFNLTDDD